MTYILSSFFFFFLSGSQIVEGVAAVAESRSVLWSRSFLTRLQLVKILAPEPVSRDPSGLEASLYSVQSKVCVILSTQGLLGNYLCKTGFTNSQLARLQVWTKLEASENSEDISSDDCSVPYI